MDDRALTKEHERAWTINEVRAHLETLRVKECARYEQATRESDKLVYIGEPCIFFEVAEREQAIRAEAAAQTAFSTEEQERLKRYTAEKRSWNPFARAAATRAESALRAEQQQRHEQALQDAMQRFQEDEIPRLQEREVEEQRAHEEYVRKSFALEQEVEDSHWLGYYLICYVLEDLEVVECAGGTHIEGIKEEMNIDQIGRVIKTYERRIPDAQNQSIRDELLRREREKLGDRRDSWSIDA